MLIDWFTVGAQAVNFMVLVWLMKRYLYAPILRAIDDREKRVAAELASADEKKAAAEAQREDLERKNESFDQERDALLEQAKSDASAERKRLFEAAREAADAMAAKRKKTLAAQAENLDAAIRLRAHEEVFAIARKALSDLATTSLEERMGEVFMRRLREMDADGKAELAAALADASPPATVRSAFDLPEEQRGLIQSALNETFSADIPLRFETSPDQVSGIELSANGRKVGWSIADYLTTMEKSVTELVEGEDAPEPRPEIEAAAPRRAEALARDSHA